MVEYWLQFPMLLLDSALCMFDIASIRYNGIKINMARKPETIQREFQEDTPGKVNDEKEMQKRCEKKVRWEPS